MEIKIKVPRVPQVPRVSQAKHYKIKARGTIDTRGTRATLYL